MTGPSIRAVQLTKRFGHFTALDTLNLDIEGSKCVGFLGPNGAGKTTALKMFANMIFPTSGEAYINGVDVRRDRKKALSSAGVLIETPEIYPSLSPREALRMVADLRGVPTAEQPARIEQALTEVKMLDWADGKVGRFSKGMKQRINIAASLVHDPEVVLLDEPTTGLDPRGMAEVRAIVRGLKQGHRLIFMSSHILSEVEDICDEVAFLNRGHLLFYDKLALLTAASAGKVGFDVVFRHPVEDAVMQARLATIPGVTSVDRLAADRFHLLTDHGVDNADAVAGAIAGLGLGLVSFSPSVSALEQTYLQLIERGD